jgi:hypothetical protein
MQETELLLSDILDGKEIQGELTEGPESNDDKAVAPVPEGFCIECEDQPAQLHCEQCTDDFCEVCYASQHRKGTRKKHTSRQLGPGPAPLKRVENSATKETDPIDEEHADDMLISPIRKPESTNPSSVGSYFLERAKYIPLRLTLQERKMLRLLEAALNVSEYTDKIDVIVYASKTKRIVAQIRELCAILSGLVMASDYRVGQELFQDRNFEDNAEFLSHL